MLYFSWLTAQISSYLAEKWQNVLFSRIFQKFVFFEIDCINLWLFCRKTFISQSDFKKCNIIVTNCAMSILKNTTRAFFFLFMKNQNSPEIDHWIKTLNFLIKSITNFWISGVFPDYKHPCSTQNKMFHSIPIN